jgi:hypothetical protein
VVARASDAPAVDVANTEAFTAADVVVSGGFDLPEPTEAELRRTVRTHPDLPWRLAAESIAAGSAAAVVATTGPRIAAASLAFALGMQRGASQPVLAAVFDRPAASPLVVADVAARPASQAVARALAAALADCLGASGDVKTLSSDDPVESFASALADPSVAVVIMSDSLGAGLTAGWLAAGAAGLTYVVLGTPAVAVVGPLAVAVARARRLLDKNLVGCTAQALAEVVSSRRQAAGLESRVELFGDRSEVVL